MSKDADFLQSALGDSDSLTPEQAAEYLDLMADPGDTGSTPENTPSAPGAGDAQSADDASKQAAISEGSLTNDTAAILAKDGKHLIDYSKLTDARERERAARADADAWRMQAEDARRQLDELRSKASASGEPHESMDNQASAAQAAIDAGVDPEIFGDFSEEALAAGIAKLVDAQVAARVSESLKAIDAKLAPMERRAAEDATSQHYGAIYKAHPDADSVIESREFGAWKASLPSMMRAAVDVAFDKGSASQIVEVFDAYKQASGANLQGASTGAEKAAQAAKANSPTIPTSLSDIPGGRPGAASSDESLAGMSGQELIDAMASMSPERIEKFLNSQI